MSLETISSFWESARNRVPLHFKGNFFQKYFKPHKSVSELRQDNVVNQSLIRSKNLSHVVHSRVDSNISLDFSADEFGSNDTMHSALHFLQESTELKDMQF